VTVADSVSVSVIVDPDGSVAERTEGNNGRVVDMACDPAASGR
jgi:subtilase family serine protease